MSFAIDSFTSVRAHWSADAIVGLSDGDPVSSLPDSISGWNLTGTTTTRPLYRPTGIGGLPAIEFDGVDDYLVSVAKTLSMVNPTVARVVQIITAKNFGGMYALTTASSVPTWLGAGSKIIDLSSSVYTAVGTGNSTNQTSYPLVSGTKTMIVGRTGNRRTYTENGFATRRNADNAESNPNVITAESLYSHFGRTNIAGSFYHGRLAEIILWDETLLGESTYIEGSLAAKYGITLPTAHPFYVGPPTDMPSLNSNIIIIED